MRYFAITSYAYSSSEGSEELGFANKLSAWINGTVFDHHLVLILEELHFIKLYFLRDFSNFFPQRRQQFSATLHCKFIVFHKLYVCSRNTSAMSFLWESSTFQLTVFTHSISILLKCCISYNEKNLWLLLLTMSEPGTENQHPVSPILLKARTYLILTDIKSKLSNRHKH